MKQLVKSVLVAAAFTFAAGSSVAVYAQEQQAQSLDELLELVQQNRASSQRINAEREAEFTSERADKQALLNRAQRQLADEQARGERLQAEFAENEISLANKETELQNALGTLGEIVGVARGAAGDTIGRIATSIVSSQFPGREDVLESIAEANEVPRIQELEELWLAWLTEMKESGRVVTFNSEVTLLDGSSETRDVTRIGVFNLLSDGEYFVYNDSAEEIQPLGRQPEGFVLSAAENFLSADSGFESVYIDPARGQILGLATQKATWSERYHQGDTVGYVITAVMIVGLLIALFKIITLSTEGAKMRSQLKNTGNPSDKNALGRILKVYQENANTDVENLELKLDEAIMRETPRIESGINIIKIFAAIAPLLGLLGTVVGMIGTFQSITLFGTGDPKIMAGDISMALVTTAMGLIAAIPLILAHALVHGRAKKIFHVLDEQAAGIVAAHAEKKGNPMIYLMELWESIRDFLGTGGDVLYIVMGTLFLMWALMVERFWFLTGVFPKVKQDIITKWNAREDTTSWYAHKIRDAWISEAAEKLDARIFLIKTCVALCPLIGLLGTVTGMIAVFEVMAVQGTGNPRLMASGISMATIPTMAGMVAALSGMFFATRLEARVKRAKNKLIDSLPHH